MKYLDMSILFRTFAVEKVIKQYNVNNNPQVPDGHEEHGNSNQKSEHANGSGRNHTDTQ